MNPRPYGCEPYALPTELQAQILTWLKISIIKWGPLYVGIALPTELQAHELFSPHIIPQLFLFVKSFFHFFQKIFVAFPKTVSYNIFCYPSSAYSCGIGLAQ